VDAGQFLSALMAIVVIDIVLAGDNAIVIALAARQLPPQLQRRAIVWGALGAVAVRIVLTAAVVWLLKIPGLLAIGGALLLWIAWKLLQPDESLPGRDEPHAPLVTGFWSAMRTVIVADALMGLDNVLAVAGAAHGSLLLVVIGLAISVPIVMSGSTLVLKVVERFPAVVYVGSGVLVWTAVTMMLNEPMLRGAIASAMAPQVLYLLVPLLLLAAFLHNHRRLESRIHARLQAMTRPRARTDLSDNAGEPPMLNVLVPIDGSDNSLNALRHAVDEYRRDHDLRLHLLHVQPRLSRHISRFVSRRDRTEWHRERAQGALAGARELLHRAGVPFSDAWCMGDRATEICRAAQRLQCHHIVIGTARKNSLTRMLEDSVTHRVLEDATVPVEVVVGREVSKLERWGLPAGVGLGLGGLLYVTLAD